ncbi:hypothetical protein STEG23_000713 [Scotinomys teguina]
MELLLVPAASHLVDVSGDAATWDKRFTTACSENSHQDHRVTRNHWQSHVALYLLSYSGHILLPLSLAGGCFLSFLLLTRLFLFLVLPAWHIDQSVFY